MTTKDIKKKIKKDFPNIKEKSRIKYKMPSKERQQILSDRSIKKENGSKKKSSFNNSSKKLKYPVFYLLEN